MKLFVVLLALRLIAGAKLNHSYLPPPGAKLSGGRSDDLQTPLEYPKETPTYSTSEYGSNVYASDYTDSGVKIGTPQDDLSMVTNGHYYENLSHLTSGLNPGHMPIIPVPESVGQNYQPHLFGMYGGNPMSFNHFDNNIEVAGLDDLITSDKMINNPQAYQYLPTTPRPNKGTVVTVPLERNGQNLLFKKFERPQANSDRSAIVLNYENVQNPDEYYYNFETSNGIHRDESASTLNGVQVKGSYTYKGDDGKVYTVTYTADENGFQPSGDHLPKIPEAIQNLSEQAKKDKDAGVIDDGSYDESKYGHMKYQGPVHRYMEKNAKTHVRKKISGEQKISGPSKIKNYETNNVMKTRNLNLQSKQNKIIKPYGMRKVQLFDISRNKEDAMYIQSPKTIKNQDYTFDSQKVNNNIFMSKSMILQNNQRNSGILNSNNEKAFEIPSIQEGYFYVPPDNVFVDGKYQGKPFTDTNLNNNTVLKTEFNTYDQINEKYIISDKVLPKMTQFITSTKKPFYQQTYNGDFHASTNDDMELSIDNTKTTLKASPKKQLDTNKKLYNNILTTKPYDNDFTKEIVQEDETAIPQNIVELNNFSSKDDFETSKYQSTTPMSAEERYTIKTYENNDLYKTTLSESKLTTSDFNDDYFENGYVKTTPEKPATFEDFSSSTYNPSIYTTQGIFSEDSISTIKLDEVGRTPLDSEGYLTGSSINILGNRLEDEIESKASTPYNNYEETLRADEPTIVDVDDKSFKSFSNDFGSVVNNTLDNLHLGRDTIIGEDFSGPKQSQRYDPKEGYYY